MMNKGVAIKYGDVAPEAKESFTPKASEQEFDTLAQLQQYNLNFPNYGNPCELYSVVLDGDALAIPSKPETANMGLWSKQTSGQDGIFAEPIVLELESEGQYSSQGLTFTFDTYNNIYPTQLSIQWIRNTTEGIETLDTMEFNPDNAFYFCQNQVTNYNKLIITFYSLNMPYNRLKLRVIDYGYGTFFYGSELRNVQLTQSVDPISTEIKINTCDFVLDSKSNIEYSFQAKQPLSIYFSGDLYATTFVESSARSARFLWSVKSEDYIGLMEDVPFMGDIYVNKVAYSLLEDIFKTAKVPYTINEELKSVTVSGHIPVTTCRNALMQVAFAVQNVVSTAMSDKVNVFALDNSEKQTIPRSRIKQGISFIDETVVTGVELTVHTYEPKSAYSEDGEIIRENAIVAYNAKEDGVETNVLVKFDEPLHSLYSLNEGEILESSANYALINAYSENFRVIGFGYEHTTQTKRKKRSDVGALTIEKVIPITDATLITASNANTVLESCFDWLTTTKSTKLSIVEGIHIKEGQVVKWGEKKWGAFKWGERSADEVTYDSKVNVGEKLNAETEYMGIVNGRAIEQAYNLNSNTIVKETVLK